MILWLQNCTRYYQQLVAQGQIRVKSTSDRGDMEQGQATAGACFCCVSIIGWWELARDLSPLLFHCQLSHLIPLPSDPCCALSVNTSSGLWRQFYLRSDAETSDRLLLSVWTTNTAIMKVVEKANTHNLMLFQAERLCLRVYGKEALWACTSVWQPIWVLIKKSATFVCYFMKCPAICGYWLTIQRTTIISSILMFQLQMKI